MMAGEFLRKVGGLEFCFGFGDAGHAEIFDEDMRCEEDESADVVVGPG